MNNSLKMAVVTIVAFVLIVTMARISGFLLLPLLLLTGIGLAYVGSQLLTGGATYPRWAAGVFTRTECRDIELSSEQSCDSCTDDVGHGERRTTYSELVFLGVPLSTVKTEIQILCRVCANPLDAVEEMDEIDHKLLHEKESEYSPD